MPYYRPNLTTLRDQIYSDIVSSTGQPVLRKSILGSLAWAFAAAVNGVYSYIDWVARQSTPFTATDEYLAAWGALKGVSRNLATAASGTTVFTLTGPATILASSQLVRSDGTVFFVTTATTGTSSGPLVVPVTASEPGAAGNCASGTTLTLTSPVIGVVSASTSNTITGGVDDETNDLLRTRILQRYAAPPQGGNADDYVTWAFDTPGVTRAWVNPNGAGPGTVVVYTMFDSVNATNGGFPFGTGGVPSDEFRVLPHATLDLLAVADNIYPVRPVTALVYSVAPIAQPINFTIAGLSPNTSLIQAQIKANLTQVFLQRSSPIPTTIYPDAFYAAIEAVPGILHFDLNAPADPITNSLGHLPVLGTVTFS